MHTLEVDVRFPMTVSCSTFSTLDPNLEQLTSTCITKKMCLVFLGTALDKTLLLDFWVPLQS